MLLSTKGIKEFELINMHVAPLMLSSNLFSCVKLERLTLYNCSLYPTPIFCGFPCLLHLDLDEVAFENGNFGEFITHCPLLELLKISCFSSIGKVKLVENAELKNLKWLSFPLCKLDTVAISNFVGHLSKLQELDLDLHMCEVLEIGFVPSFATSGPLVLNPIDFSSDIELSFAFEMIWGLPELQNLEITAALNGAVTPLAFSSSTLNHISMGQLKLRSVVFKCCRGLENEICLIKKLLACSPFLKKIDICASSSLIIGGDNGKLMFAMELLKLHRASSVAEVNIYWN